MPVRTVDEWPEYSPKPADFQTMVGSGNYRITFDGEDKLVLIEIWPDRESTPGQGSAYLAIRYPHPYWDAAH